MTQRANGPYCVACREGVAGAAGTIDVVSLMRGALYRVEQPGDPPNPESSATDLPGSAASACAIVPSRAAAPGVARSHATQAEPDDFSSFSAAPRASRTSDNQRSP